MKEINVGNDIFNIFTALSSKILIHILSKMLDERIHT